MIVVDVDIQKPDTGYLKVIERPGQLSRSTSHQTLSGSQSPQSLSPPEYTGYIEPVSEGEDEDMDVAPAKNESERTGLSGAAVEEAIASREKMLKQRKEDKEMNDKPSSIVPLEPNECEEGSSTGRRPRHQKEYSFSSALKSQALSISPLAHSSIFDRELQDKLQETQQAQVREATNATNGEDGEDRETEDLDEAPSGNDRIMVKDWRAPPGKRISVPVRVEPKVYFAVERTFLVSSCYSIPYFLTSLLFVEMAQYLSLYWYYRNDSSQLCSSQ